jgi:hypothetical protein
MKYIAKMMLALLASVTMVAQAYAWDFSASGTMQSQFNQTTTVASSGSPTQTSGGVTSEGSGLTLKSSNTDGDHSATFSYVADWDGNLDETITVSGSKKAGKWTGSANVSYNIGAGAQTGEDTGAVTVTDGTMTITLGDAGHLSGQNVSSSSVAGGSVSMDGADDDLGIGAFVDGFHGVSVGYKMSDTMSVTVAYQSTSEGNDLLGAQEFMDNETAAYGTSGFGAGLSLAAGPASIGATFGSASTADNSGAGGSKKTDHTVLGLGVKLDLGDMKPFISFGSNSSKGAESGAEATNGGFEVGLTMAMGSDSIVAYFGSVTEGGSETTSTTGLEVGYNTTVGPSSLGIGYGSKTNSDSGYAYSDIEVQMKLSF